MNRISTYFPVASKELHAVLEMVANVEEKELSKKSAAAKIVAGRERSGKILQRYATSPLQQQSSQLLISSPALFL